MISFSRQEVLDCCAQYGSRLRLPDGLDGPKVMAAISSNESSLGANCGPRHEPAYDVGGSLAKGAQQAAALAHYGKWAAYSYGPWQMMFVNFQGVTPAQLNADIDLCALGFVRFFNTYVIDTRRAQTLVEIGQVWNLGRIAKYPPAGVALYCQHLQSAYDVAR